MSTAAPNALLADVGSGMRAADTMLEPVKRNIRLGRQHRKQFEPTWHSNLAFAAGKHWLEWDRLQRTLVMPKELRDKELYTADVITEYRTTMLGELGSDDDRPELLLRRDDLPSERFQEELNKAVAFGWDNEWSGDDALAEVDRLTLDLGTAAMRCRWDPSYGPVVQDNVPYVDGKPVLDIERAAGLFDEAGGPTDGVTMGQIQQGRICWDPLSTFNLIVPPGVPHERYFPWECILRPVPLDAVQSEYGDVAADLKEDTDIGSVYGWSTTDGGGNLLASIADRAAGGSGQGRLRDHVWLFTYLEKPTRRFRDGRTIVFATNQLTPLRIDTQLPYRKPDGSPSSGIAYFHWWRVTGRFWSRALVEAMKDGQRIINRRRTQQTEIIDRAMPFWFVQKDSNAIARSGTPGEFVELDPAERQPMPSQGAGPGPWMQGDVEALREDLDHATGIKAVRLGENPQNITTYSQLALVNENDQAKRSTIIFERKRAIASLVEDSVYDIRTYWGPDRILSLAADGDFADATRFNATKTPAFYIVRIPTGTTQPRSQAAELQKIQDIGRYSIEAGQPLPVQWYKDSLEAGQAVDLPEQPTDAHAEKAELENHLLMQGEQVPVDYFDPPATHIPIHRIAQIQARLAGRQDLFDTIEQHIQEHQQVATEQAAQVQAAAQGVAPGAAAPAQAQAGDTLGISGRFPGQPPYGDRLERPI